MTSCLSNVVSFTRNYFNVFLAFVSGCDCGKHVPPNIYATGLFFYLNKNSKNVFDIVVCRSEMILLLLQ